MKRTNEPSQTYTTTIDGKDVEVKVYPAGYHSMGYHPTSKMIRSKTAPDGRNWLTLKYYSAFCDDIMDLINVIEQCLDKEDKND